jgi:hypothetical protein
MSRRVRLPDPVSRSPGFLRPIPYRHTVRRLKALFSLELFPFAVLLVLALISILSRAWLLAKPLLFSHVGP